MRFDRRHSHRGVTIDVDCPSCGSQEISTNDVEDTGEAECPSCLQRLVIRLHIPQPSRARITLTPQEMFQRLRQWERPFGRRTAIGEERLRRHDPVLLAMLESIYGSWGRARTAFQRFREAGGFEITVRRATNPLPRTDPVPEGQEVEQGGTSLRCPYCFGPLTDGTALYRCSGCRTRLHDVCALELRRCTTRGCARAYSPANRTDRAVTARHRRIVIPGRPVPTPQPQPTRQAVVAPRAPVDSPQPLVETPAAQPGGTPRAVSLPPPPVVANTDSTRMDVPARVVAPPRRMVTTDTAPIRTDASEGIDLPPAIARVTLILAWFGFACAIGALLRACFSH